MTIRFFCLKFFAEKIESETRQLLSNVVLELELTFHGFNLMTREISVVNDVNIKNPKCWGWLILFASTSTLLCCALPILLVSLGLGAVVVSMASSLPFLVTLSQH